MYFPTQMLLLGTIAIAVSQLHDGSATAQQLLPRGGLDVLAQAEPSHPGEKEKNEKQIPGKQPPGQQKGVQQPRPVQQTPAQKQPAPPKSEQQPAAKGAPTPMQGQEHRQPPGAPPQAPTHAQQPQPPQPPKGAQQQLPPRPQPAVIAPSGPTAPQNGRQLPAQPQPVQGPQRVEDLRKERHERVENNRTVIEEPGRVIIKENGHAIIRHDETERFRLFGGDVHVEKRGQETVTVVPRPDGVEIITVVDADGRLVRRIRRGRDGREFVLIDNRPRPGMGGNLEAVIALPPPRIIIPRDEYVVDMERAPPQRIIETLEAPPVEPIVRAYTLDEIRYSPQLRDRMRRIDLDTINFETGSWRVDEDQVSRLGAVADAMNAIISRHPNEMFLVEGHTDAVGGDVDNLSLSDRRAESVALVLTQSFQVPPENLVTQGYGAHELKVPTQEPSRENRRVTIRRVTPLLTGSAR